jgi:hypothetical protein
METSSRGLYVQVFTPSRDATIVGRWKGAMKTNIFRRTIGIHHLGKLGAFLDAGQESSYCWLVLRERNDRIKERSAADKVCRA